MASDQAFKWGKLVAIPLLIGFITGLAVVSFLLIYDSLWKITHSFIERSAGLYIFLMPMIGITLAFLIVRFFAISKTTGCGAHVIIESYNFYSGVIPLRDTIGKVLASAITIGFGGSAGLEGPSMLLGGGLASSLVQKIKLRPEEMRIYVLAGAAAGLSAIFKAPLTGILFALEIPYRRDLAKEAFIPAAVASVASYLTLISIVGAETLFPIISAPLVLSIFEAAHLVLVGLLASITSLVFIGSFKLASKLRTVLTSNRLILALLGGVVVGASGFFAPDVLGAGYETIGLAVQGRLSLLPLTFLVLVVLLKILATSVTLNFGGSGGLFIPSIYIGAVLGSIYAAFLPSNFGRVVVMATMASVLASANKTLLTSVAFVAETCGPASVIPALVASSISFFTSGKYSLYEAQLPERAVAEERALHEAYHLMHIGKVSKKLAEVKVSELMTPKPVSVKSGTKIEEALGIIKEHGFRVYPVVDENGALVGHLTLEDLLAVPLSMWSMPVDYVAVKPPLKVTAGENLLSVISKMVEMGEDHIYVVSDTQSNKLVGVVAGIDVLKKFLESARKV